MFIEPILLFLIVIIGLISGLIIGKLTPEEFKEGKLYYQIIQIIILISLFVLVLYNGFNLNMILFIIIGFALLYFIKEEYFVLGILFFSNIFSLSVILVSLLFLYGLPIGTLNNNYRNLLRKIIFFTVTFPILWFNISIINGIILGGLLYGIVKKIHLFWK